MTGSDPQANDRLLRRLRSRRTLARWALLFEALWPALWPAFGIAGLSLCFALLGFPRLLGPWLHLALLLAAGVAFLVLLVRGFRDLLLPDEAAADRRLERSSGLQHRPLAALFDRPARIAGVEDAAQEALWAAHRERAINQVRRLRVGLPHPELARLDRRALRGALVVSLVAAMVIAGSDAPARLADAVSPGLPIDPLPPVSQLQVWITPPSYTGQPPLFLRPGGDPISVPAGAHVTASLTGSEGEPPALVLNSRSEPFRALDRASFQGDIDLDAGGRLAVRRDGREIAGWELVLLANQAPERRLV